MINNGPEKKDANFTIDALIATNNGELLNKFGNLVNRTLKFKELEEIPEGKLDENIKQKIEETYKLVGKNIENLEFKQATDIAMELVETANKYYDEQKPWIQKKENLQEFNNTIFTCSVIIANLANIFEPFMPSACTKIRKYLNIQEKNWQLIEPKIGLKLDNIEPLFSRM